MVIKLIKNNFEDSFRMYLPALILIGVFILLGAIGITQAAVSINNAYYGSGFNYGSIFTLMFLVLVGWALAIVLIVSSVRVVYSSIYKRNAYRLFTFPVKMWEIFVSKLAIVVFWNIVCGLLVILGLILIVGIGGLVNSEINTAMGYVYANIGEVLKVLGMNNVFNIILLIIESFFSSLRFVSIVLLAGAIAHTSSVTKHRSLITFALWAGITMVLSVISANLPASFTISDIFYGTSIYSTIDSSIFEFSSVNLLISVGYQILVVAGCMFGTVYLWEHKLQVIS